MEARGAGFGVVCIYLYQFLTVLADFDVYVMLAARPSLSACARYGVNVHAAKMRGSSLSARCCAGCSLAALTLQVPSRNELQHVRRKRRVVVVVY